MATLRTTNVDPPYSLMYTPNTNPRAPLIKKMEASEASALVERLLRMRRSPILSQYFGRNNKPPRTGDGDGQLARKEEKVRSQFLFLVEIFPPRNRNSADRSQPPLSSSTSARAGFARNRPGRFRPACLAPYHPSSAFART